MAPNLYIAFSVLRRSTASDLAIPMPSHTGFFEQLIAKIDYTSSNAVWGLGIIFIVTVVKIKLYYPKM